MLGRRSNRSDNGRRSRTGSSSQRKAFSYYNSPVNFDNKSTNNREGRAAPKNFLRLLPAIVAATVIVFSLLFSTTLSTDVSIEAAGDQPTPYRTSGEYADAAGKILSGSITNRSKFTINTSKVEEDMLKAFPELNAVAVRLPVLGRRPTIVLGTRQPAMILNTASSSVILDDMGIATSTLGEIDSGHLQGLPVVSDQSGLKPEMGKIILPSDTIGFIREVKRQLEDKGLRISKMNLPVSANELDISIDGLNYFVKTDTSYDARLQIGSFLAVKQHLESSGAKPAEYIDVRVEEKAFYK